MDWSDKKKLPYVTFSLIGLNAIYFLFLEIIGSTEEDALFMMRHGAAYAPYIIEQKEYYRIFTAMFMHFGINHIANNMLILFVLGDHLEKALGKVKYLILYLLSGVGGGIVSVIYHYKTAPNVVTAGASGAIFGVIGALFCIVLFNKGQLEGLSRNRMGFLILISLYHGFTAGGVDNAGHVGGLLTGMLLALMLYRKPRREVLDYGERW